MKILDKLFDGSKKFKAIALASGLITLIKIGGYFAGIPNDVTSEICKYIVSLTLGGIAAQGFADGLSKGATSSAAKKNGGQNGGNIGPNAK